MVPMVLDSGQACKLQSRISGQSTFLRFGARLRVRDMSRSKAPETKDLCGIGNLQASYQGTSDTALSKAPSKGPRVTGLTQKGTRTWGFRAL